MQPFFKQMVCLYDIEQTTASSSTRQQLLSSPWKFDIFSSILPFLLIQFLFRDPVTECIGFFSRSFAVQCVSCLDWRFYPEFYYFFA